MAQTHETDAQPPIIASAAPAAPAATASTPPGAPAAPEQNRWLLPGILSLSLGFPLMIWRLARRKPSHSLLPANAHHAQITGTVISCPSCTSAIVLPLELTQPIGVPALGAPPAAPRAPAHSLGVALQGESEYWKERALAAERRTEKTTEVLRAGAIPLARSWLGKVARKLASQRAHLLETQQRAEHELAELEERLASVQAPLKERLKAYEERIAELQNDLSAKGKENRELIEATIAMAKKKLKLERSKDPMGWN